MAGPTLDNGELLAPALEHFDVFVTVDRNLSVNGISHRDRSLVVLDARTNRLADLKPLLSKASRSDRFGPIRRSPDRSLARPGPSALDMPSMTNYESRQHSHRRPELRL